MRKGRLTGRRTPPRVTPDPRLKGDKLPATTIIPTVLPHKYHEIKMLSHYPKVRSASCLSGSTANGNCVERAA